MLANRLLRDLCLFISSLALANNVYLTTSAVVTDAENNAAIECWQFDEPFYRYPTTGLALPLADVSNVTLVRLPPRSQEGLHKPPHAM